MRKPTFIFVCFIWFTTLNANLLHPTLVEHNTLDENVENEKTIGENGDTVEENKHIVEETQLQNNNLKEQVTPSSALSTEAKSFENKQKDTKTQSDDNKEGKESNEVHSRERRPSLVERLMHHKDIKDDKDNGHEGRDPVPCTCGVFLSGQFKKGSKKQPKGLPVLTQEMDTPFMNNAVGNRQCTNKCLELIIKHLPKSNEIICATVDRDEVLKERAYLFIKNHSDKWHGTNLSAGREFCCKDNIPYKCPIN